MRGVVSGLIWGGVVSVFGLGVVSQLAPLPGAKTVANDIGAPEAVSVGEPVEAPDAVGTEPLVAEAQPEPEAGPVETEAVVPVPSMPETPKPEAAQVENVVPEVVAPSAAPDIAALAPVDPAAPLPGEVPAHSPLAPELVPEAEAAVPLEPVAPAEPLLDRPSVAEVVPEPVMPASVLPEPVTPEAGTAAHVAPEVPVPQAPVSESVTPEPVTPEPVAPLAPAAGLSEAVAGVTTNRLPRIEAAAEAPTAEAAPDATPAPEAESGAGLAADAADSRPLARFAARFENAAGKPLYAILLLDDGAAGVDRAALAALPLPLTIVLDPSAPETGKLAAEYRKAGKEVAMLATAIPKGATASDLQVSFEAHAKALPEAVAVVDLPIEGFQNNRKLAADLLPVIKDQGRGLVTFDKGLNAGDQVARREGVPAALIFRELDAEGEAAPLIRRYLDRAAFKAVQDGRVAVLGRARPETIAALLEWSVEGRAGSVALAPLTAVLSVPE